MSPLDNRGRSETDTPGASARFRVSREAVYNRLGDDLVLIHMQTNRICELNRTGARVWELLCAGHDRDEIGQILRNEFEVSEEQLARELAELLASLQREQLISPLASP